MFEKIVHTFLFIAACVLIVIGFQRDRMSAEWIIYSIIAINTLNIVLAFTIFQSDRIIDSKISWILTLFLLPFFGAVLYFIFGRPYKEKEARSRSLDNKNDLLNFESWTESKKFFRNSESHTAELLQNIAKRPLYTQTTFEYMQDGVEKMKNAIKDMKEAKNYIHIMYFIIKKSDIWNEIEEVLLEKAREGVEIKILVDGAGSYGFPKKKIKELKKYNIDFKIFKKIRLMSKEINYRNHRKMIIIDGKSAYTGGINIGDEYMHKSKKFGYWRDSAVRIQGSAIISLQLIFLMDWKFATNIRLSPARYIKQIKPVVPNAGDSVLVADDGPGIGSHVFMTTIVKQILKASDKIWITTPYLVLPKEVESALKIASKSGVDIRIIIPGLPDKKYVYFASLLEARELVSEGIKIYKYDENFIHAKQIIVDDKVMFGTSNFDKRSFTQNYELFLFIKSQKFHAKLISEFERDFKRSTLVKVDTDEPMRLLDGIRRLVVKLVSPLF